MEDLTSCSKWNVSWFVRLLSLVLVAQAMGCLFVDDARAACSAPAANIGSLDFQSGSFKYCDGTNWQSLGGLSFPLLAPNGSAASPSFSFSAGTNTGMYSTGVGTISFSTAGTQRMVIDSSGNVGIGTSAPTSKLDVNGGIKISDDTSGCSSARAGSIKYVSSNLHFCDGSSWQPLQLAVGSVGSQLYMTPGTVTWTVPAGVTSISVAAIGGGGGGASQASGNSGAGGGGALCYSNGYAVTPGANITVVVGFGGAAGVAGSASIFSVDISAGGGAAGSGGTGGAGGTGSTVGGSCYVGGAGGSFSGSGTNFGAGGGGAAGYSGNGGQGGNSSGSSVPTNQAAGAGGGGGGGGGASSSSDTSNGSGAGGGGTGPFGSGANGVAGSSSTSHGSGQTGGGGGSAGAPGGPGTTSSTSTYAGDGGQCGGGGGGRSTYVDTATGRGGHGCVRIIWGSGRSYPDNAN